MAECDDFHAHGRIDCFGLSDAGAAHNLNADQFLIADFRKLLFVHRSTPVPEDQTRYYGSTYGQLLMVADGAGTGRAGQFASAAVVDCVTDHLLRRMDLSHHAASGLPVRTMDELRAVFQQSGELLKTAAAVDPRLRRMSTTLTLAYIVWPQLYLVHAGDSRCYLYRNSRLRRLTTDHTVAEKMVEAGVLRPENAQTSPWRNVLWKAIGVDDAKTDPDIHQIHLIADDTLLLCTAGLARHVDDTQIADLLGEMATPQEICQCLLQGARNAGATDNITVIAARLRDAEPQERPGSETAFVPAEAPDAVESR